MKIDIIRHSLSHIMAHAVKNTYGNVKLGIGPTIENGFYYDFALPVEASGEGGAFLPGDLPRIEKRMRELIKQNIKFEKSFATKEQAKKIFKDQPYKLELIKDLSAKKVTIYKSEEFTDLCAGPHVKTTKEINPDAFKLTKIAGAYWRGSEKNPMLQRIYAVAFETKNELDNYLKQIEEAEKRDHRVLGKKLDLFVFSDLVGKGLPLFTEKGSIIRREMERFIIDEEIKRGYKHVYTPDIAKVDLYKKSGHYPYYKDSMYPVMKIEGEELILRPMTCPHHFQLYASRPRSYKELPMRIAELAKQFRYEKSGELSGLFRVRLFCLADAHIICKKEQASDEINGVLDLIEFVADALGLEKIKDFRYRLSLGDRKDNKKYYKDDKAWSFAENVLRTVLKQRKAPFFEAKGEAAFYGPKIDIQMKDFSGKENTAFTVQYDFVMPKRFELTYIDKDGSKKEAIVIHRSSIGAIERVMAFLIEHYAGALPFWLSPVQVEILPVGEKHRNFAQKIRNIFAENKFRVEADESDETLGKKIREAELQKIPYIIVVGDKEMNSNNLAVRSRGKKEIETIDIDKFIEKIKKELK
ncbi:MAG: threonine--tRNA ligase [bacterium]|nr:threonine--tRNA ligase [bacterium]